MAISFLGRVVGAAQGVLHLVNGEGEQATEHASSQAYHAATPEQLVVKAEGQDAAARVHQVLAGLAGEGPLGAAIAAIKPELKDALPFGEDDQDLINWLLLYQHFKAALANDGKVDDLINWLLLYQHFKAALANDGKVDGAEFSALLAEAGQNLHAGELVGGWLEGILEKLTGTKKKAAKK